MGDVKLVNRTTDSNGVTLDPYPVSVTSPPATNEFTQSRNADNLWTISEAGGEILKDFTGLDGTANTGLTLTDTSDTIITNVAYSTVGQPVQGEPFTFRVFILKEEDESSFPEIVPSVFTGDACNVQINRKTGEWKTRSPESTQQRVEVVDHGLWFEMLMEIHHDIAPVGNLAISIYPAMSTVLGGYGGASVTGQVKIGNIECYYNRTLEEVKGLGPIFTEGSPVSTDEVSVSHDSKNLNADSMALSIEGTINGDTVVIEDFVYAVGGNIEVNERPPFVSIWRTEVDNEIVQLPINTSINDMIVDWGDGSVEHLVNSGYPQHTYSTPGDYRVAVSGNVASINQPNDEYADKLIEVIQLGHCGWTSFTYGFAWASNCQKINLAPCDTSNVTNFLGFLSVTGCTEINIDGIDTSNGTNITSLFNSNNYLEVPPDMSQITVVGTSMYRLFRSLRALKTPPDFSTFDMSGIENIGAMLQGIGTDNNLVLPTMGLEQWDVSSVTDGTGFLLSSTLSTEAYDQILINWQPQLQGSGWELDFGLSKYTIGSPAETARQAILDQGILLIDAGGI